jgi:hypothetical protein
MLAACLRKQHQQQQQLSSTPSLINLLSPATHHLWDTLFSVKENTVEYFCALNQICCCCEIQIVSLSSLLLQNPENSLSMTKKKIKNSNLICAIAALCVLLVATMASHFLGLLLSYHKKKERHREEL